jgi:hypothetical protein
VDPIAQDKPSASTLADLRASGWRSRTVKEELRANLLERLAVGSSDGGPVIWDIPKIRARLRELDVNPMIVRPLGNGVVAVDALIRIG